MGDPVGCAARGLVDAVFSDLKKVRALRSPQDHPFCLTTASLDILFGRVLWGDSPFQMYEKITGMKIRRETMYASILGGSTNSVNVLMSTEISSVKSSTTATTFPAVELIAAIVSKSVLGFAVVNPEISTSSPSDTKCLTRKVRYVLDGPLIEIATG
jgi:hypothetical protein